MRPRNAVKYLVSTLMSSPPCGGDGGFVSGGVGVWVGAPKKDAKVLVALEALDDTGGTLEGKAEEGVVAGATGGGFDNAGAACSGAKENDVALELAVPNPEKPANFGAGFGSDITSDAGTGVGASEPARDLLGRPRIVLPARTLSSAFLNPCPGSTSSIASSSASSRIICFSAPRFMVRRCVSCRKGVEVCNNN